MPSTRPPHALIYPLTCLEGLQYVVQVRMASYWHFEPAVPSQLEAPTAMTWTG